MKNEDIDIVIVGAGPIGLAYAWGIKNLNPELNIIVLEKYQQYQRKHTLIMEPEPLQQLIGATASENEKSLQDLLEQLKKDKHIRTNQLEETFKKLAQEKGVVIDYQEVKDDTIKEQIYNTFPNAGLIIGADGTHSVVSRALFGRENQTKHQFDFVLQLRYEVRGEQKSPEINLIDLTQLMARTGYIANEYVGAYDAEKQTTPVTMQMMISQEEFEQLAEKATSKNPIYLFSNENQEGEVLPEAIVSFITQYIKERRTKNGELDEDLIRISVNEAPATHAVEVCQEKDNRIHYLAGDAAMGLSYFKGLNAGIEAAAHWFDQTRNALKQRDNVMLLEGVNSYADWFSNTFVPEKIDEVARYSKWRINSLMGVMKTARWVKNASAFNPHEDHRPIMRLYFLHRKNGSEDKLYIHRDYDPVYLGQFKNVPISHSLKKIAKIFIDFFKPYKGQYQLVQDFKQPLVGGVNVFVGFIKFFYGLCTLSPKRMGDGLFRFTRGLMELVTTPLVWLVKPLTRGIASLPFLLKGSQKIEDNPGMKKLAKLGLEEVKALENSEQYDDQHDDQDYDRIYKIKCICADLHRKYNKNKQREQESKILTEEDDKFKALQEQPGFSISECKSYLGLFQPKAKEQENNEERQVLEI